MYIKKILIFVIIIFINKDLFQKNYVILFIKLQFELKRIKKYFSLCNKFNLIKIKVYRKNYNPIISIISPIYNRERYLLRFIKSVQYQNFNDIEIILVDDNSTDESIKYIEDIKKKDLRVILIKNIKNKGTFVARNIGVIFSRGKYIIIPDPDDILSKNIIHTCYYFAEKYNYEIIKFLQYNGFNIMGLEEVERRKIKPIYQSELSHYIFYGINELQQIDFTLHNKFLKKDVYLKSLNILNKSFLNMYIIFYEDQMMNYILHRISKSFFLLTKVGYYYLKHSLSITQNESKISSLQLKFILIYLKLLFKYSKNNKFEKDITKIVFNKMLKIIRYKPSLKIKEYENYYIDIFNMYIRSKFISDEDKNFFRTLKNNSLNKKIKNNKSKKRKNLFF